MRADEATGRLIPAYQRMHAAGQFRGVSIRAYIPEITELVMASGAKTLLDYGCGAGDQYLVECYHVFWDIMPTMYDPAVPGFSKRPRGQFDGVICTDVLEHVPEDELDGVIADLAGYSRVWCFMSVCCRKSHKSLPDGRNCHVTIKEPFWWMERLEAALGDRLHLRITP